MTGTPPWTVWAFVGALAVIFALSPLAARGADDDHPIPTRSTRVRAAGSGSRTTLQQKLQDIKSRQQETLSKLDELLTELQHIKTRVTIR